VSDSLRDSRDRSFHGSEPAPSANDADCKHLRVRGENVADGHFVGLRTYCRDCGKLLDEERALQGPELRRCPVDPRLDRCFTGCPVEEGSPDIFEHPCLPLIWAIEEASGKPRPFPRTHPLM
jgi:hypothetical protein